MRAVKYTSRGIEVVDVDPPSGDGVRVRIRSVSICGTDLSLIKGGPVPIVLGHEMAGELDDGRGVAIEPVAPCGSCDQCASNNYHRCRTGAACGMGLGRDGGMAQYMRVPERCLVPLPVGTKLPDACLVEPLAVVLHGLRLAEVEPHHSVAVVGGGSIGLLAVAALRALGCKVALSARYPHQVGCGERLGAVPVRGHYDRVIECAGSESALAQSCELARPGATLLLLSMYWDKIVLPGVVAMTKELRIVTSLCYNRHAGGRDFEAAAALLAQHPELGDAILTHRFSLEDARAAFAAAADRKTGAIKVVLHPE